MKNALTFGRRKSNSEEQNLLCSSQEQTDRETEDEGGIESQDETDRVINTMGVTTRTRRDSGASFMSDNQSIRSGHTAHTPGKRKNKKSNK